LPSHLLVVSHALPSPAPRVAHLQEEQDLRSILLALKQLNGAVQYQAIGHQRSILKSK